MNIHSVSNISTTFNSNSYDSFVLKLNSFKDLIPKTDLIKMIFIWWNSWFIRNEFIFNNVHVNDNKLISLCINSIKVWNETRFKELDNFDECISKSKFSSVRQSNNTHEKVVWEKPPISFFKLNFDGSKLNNDKAALGYCLIDHKGNVNLLGAKMCGSNNIIVAETLALKEGILAAKSIGISKIVIEGDNLCVINSLRGIWHVPWEISSIIKDIKLDIQSFEEIEIKHCFREANQVADFMASIGHSCPTLSRWFESHWLQLTSLIRKDEIGIESLINEKMFNIHVHAFGAVGDGVHDDTEAFKNAWKMACSLSFRSSILIPEGYTYFVRPIDFAGCQSEITLKIRGEIIAPKDPHYWLGLNHRKWLYFHNVEHLTIEGGGTINGKGKEWWSHSCKINSTLACHRAPTALTFHRCKGLKIRDINVVKSQQTHMSFTSCFGVVVSNVTLTTPAESPNTDGIHISASTDVEVRDTLIITGDDCISIVSNSSRIRVSDIFCGPGTHGISIGSLGKWNECSHVHDVMVDGAYLSNTQNGVRVKTWQGGSGFASKIMFQNVWMENVTNPIIVDQYYCDAPDPCQNQTSNVNINKISFVGIKGTSASEEVIRFACSDTFPCQQLYLEDIQLLTYTGIATSFCWNAHGSSSGLVYPPPCFPTNVSVTKQNIFSGSISSS